RNTRLPAGNAGAVNCFRYVDGPAKDCVPRSSHDFRGVVICLPFRSNAQSPPSSARVLPDTKDGSGAATPLGSEPTTTTFVSYGPSASGKRTESPSAVAAAIG